MKTKVPLWISHSRLALPILAAWLCFLSDVAAHAFPVITDISPTLGAPGTSVVISGTDLGAIQEVSFGTVPAIFQVVSAFQITTTVPLDALTGPVGVSGTSGSSTTLGEFLVAPRIVGFSPDSAPEDVVILIQGANFQGTTAVLFNGTNAAFQVTSPTQIQTRIPIGATTGPVTVFTDVGAATSPSPFIITGPEPFITSFTPAQGQPGDRVVITGFNFAGTTAVRFGGTNAPNFGVTSATQISATVPSGAASGPISVVNASGTNASLASFVVTTAPIINLFQPFGGAPGTPVVINGANFQGATAVKFGDKAANFSVTAPTQLNTTVPNGQTNGPVTITITTPQGSGTSGITFLATASPIITDFSPTTGPVGTPIVLNGLNFTGVQSVKVAGVPASFGVTAATQMTVTAPNGATNGPISVTSSTGTTSTLQQFIVRTGKPILTGFSPDAGSARASVRIDGLDLTGATAVKFNGVAALYQVVADTQISATVPDTATSGPISITTPFGSVASATPFVVAPRLLSFSPASGIAGTTVTISGANLAEVNLVQFKDAAARIVSQSATQLVTVVPDEGTIGSINVVNPAGIVAFTNFFSVLPTLARFSPTAGEAGDFVDLFGTGFGDVTAVRFAGINAADFLVLSPTQVVAIVPAGAKTGPLSVTTLSGTATSTRSFAVGAAADLVLRSTAASNVLQNETLVYSLTITNIGPSPATSVVLSNLLSSTITVLAATSSQGRVSRSDSVVRVDIGTLPVGSNAVVTIQALSSLAGTITNLASVAALEVDPDAANNAVAQVTTVSTSSAVLSLAEVAPSSLRISWPVAATNFVLQSADTFSPPLKWQAVSGTPVVSGAEKSLTVPIAGRSQFYRLFRQ